jgi:hypothetical protein
MADPLLQPSVTQGYALCSPMGVLLGHSYRKTEEEAVACVFDNPEHRAAFWKQAQVDGWSVQFVYARIFTPVYFAAQALPQTEMEGAA